MTAFDLSATLVRIASLEADAHQILAKHESSSRARIVTIEQSYSRLKTLSLDQDSLFRESLRAIENDLQRAAHVLAWAAFMDYFQEVLSRDGFDAINNVRKWGVASVEDLREHHGDHATIEAAAAAGLIAKSMKKALHGLLNKRNECAHPSQHSPDLNESLGYVSDLFRRIESLALANT